MRVMVSFANICCTFVRRRWTAWPARPPLAVCQRQIFIVGKSLINVLDYLIRSCVAAIDVVVSLGSAFWMYVCMINRINHRIRTNDSEPNSVRFNIARPRLDVFDEFF